MIFFQSISYGAVLLVLWTNLALELKRQSWSWTPESWRQLCILQTKHTITYCPSACYKRSTVTRQLI